MAGFYSARSGMIPPLPWPNFAPPFPHFKHKPKIIETSDVLSIYWEFLELAIDESEEILMFGYSGNDAHLNRLVSQVRGEKNVRVIEWLGAGNRTLRQAFWKEQLGGDVDLALLEDVLSFTDW